MICNVAWGYFNEMFKCSIDPSEEFDLHFIPYCITDDIKEKLNREFTDDEILTAFNQMDPRKAPGIDGLPGSFFKYHWQIVGKEVLKFCHEALRDMDKIQTFNETLLVLIPKVNNPCDMTNFRPINLCWVIYKIISKVLANRLKNTLPKCISENQSAFVPGRCVIKLDMSKAYDRVEWRFLEEVMLKIGFSSDWVNKIMCCVRMVTYKVKCNLKLTNVIAPERGIRQGDPLSPYLFLFCMDALSRILVNAQETHKIKGIRASRDGPRINYLFFADDALLFVRNNRREIDACMQILHNFERMSGQSINMDKSMVYFSPKTPMAQRDLVHGLLRMKVVDNIDCYLGLPTMVGKKKTEAFRSIVNRTAGKVNSWSKHLLSSAGKEIFIKTVIQVIPTYAFSVFLAPKGVIEEIHSMIGHIWWGGGERSRGWSMLAWDRMCFPNGMGGLGFRDLHLFNLALLGRQVRRLINCTNTLCYKISVSKAACSLSEGFGWSVGNGRNIDILMDNWGFEGLKGSSIRLERKKVPENKVFELMDTNREGWKEDRILDLYGESLKDQICNIPIAHAGHADQRIWFHNPYGFYSTKTAYSWMMLKRVGFGPHRFFWKMTWKLNTLPKIRIFCWRMGHEILPTYDKIASIKSGFDSLCPRCGQGRETLIHALKDFLKARAVLEFGGLYNRLIEGSFTRCIDWIEEAMRMMDKKAMADFITVLWNIWNSHNNRVFRGVEEEAKVIWERASCLSNDFRIFNMVEKPLLLISRERRGWKKLETDVIKVNFDAAFQDGQAYFGLIARENDGFVLGGRTGRLTMVKTA
ncbi:reverse transcriptase [Gossypium australe]|uniref:Reverse transcriptase n=1 Tax=Gossypium australe TaxID=47621 RepID=A0A5B6VNW1_9ROSI|nr:reverse transcriptase [Gossypium australe]